jgi:trimeric autotransporter adhesin
VKNIISVLLLFGCFALFHEARAVSPTPDGGYPGGNTAEGQSALLSLSTGIYNTAVGVFALESDSEGKFNTATGAGTLLVNTSDENTATGAGALLSNTTGGPNTANGAFALFSNMTGNNNNAFGFEALFSNTTGPFNNAFGNGALASNTTGDRNTAVGEGALLANTTGSQNIAVGVSALRNNTTGHDNIAIGQDASSQSQGGQFNTAVGADALVVNTADQNTAIGTAALGSNTAGNFNTAAGAGALFNNSTGIDNVALGISAGFNATTGSNNVYIGAGVSGVAGESNACYITSIFGQTSSGLPVLIDSNNKLGTTTSSRRFKEDIKPMDKASETLLALKPVTFRYKKEIDPAGIPQFGLVAEDVEKVNPALVVRDKEGKAYTVRYDQVNAMLLNEFLKEHREVQELQATVAQQQKSFQSKLEAQEKQIAVMTSSLRKIDAQFELSKPEQQLAFKNHGTRVCGNP